MIKTLGLAVLLVAPLAAQDASIDAVRKMVGELEQALTHADMTTLRRIVTDDFIRTPPGGKDTNKSEWLGLVESGRLNYVAFEDSEVKYRVYGDTVVVNDVSNIHTRGGDGPERATKLKLIWVWVRQDGQWRLAGVQGGQVQ
jgi:ketosteroid isomerase-like protein